METADELVGRRPSVGANVVLMEKVMVTARRMARALSVVDLRRRDSHSEQMLEPVNSGEQIEATKPTAMSTAMPTGAAHAPTSAPTPASTAGGGADVDHDAMAAAATAAAAAAAAAAAESSHDERPAVCSTPAYLAALATGTIASGLRARLRARQGVRLRARQGARLCARPRVGCSAAT